MNFLRITIIIFTELDTDFLKNKLLVVFYLIAAFIFCIIINGYQFLEIKIHYGNSLILSFFNIHFLVFEKYSTKALKKEFVVIFKDIVELLDFKCKFSFNYFEEF